jgi:serine/threonine-protein kinase
MGEVWRGTDEVLGRTVAIKVLLPALLDEPGFAERFRGEARTMATINHPGVVDVYDYGSEATTAFLVMEYVEGEALSGTLNRVGRLTPSRTMSLIAQAADALQAAHSKGVVHRDVKPGNLLVRPNGTAVLTDFGIARSAQAAQLTAVGSVLGTAAYLSPEQATGQPASRLSDLYSLGVVAYQCLAGRRPFEGDNPIEIALRHVRDLPPPLPADVPPLARQIVERAMAKDPAGRWPTASAMAEAARNAAAQLASGTTGTMVTPGSVPSGGTTAIVSSPPASRVSPTPTRRGAAVPPQSPPMSSPVSPGTRAMPMPATGQHPVPARPMSSPRAGSPGRAGYRANSSGKQQTTLLLAALATIGVVLLGVGGVYLILNEDEPRGRNGVVAPASSQSVIQPPLPKSPSKSTRPPASPTNSNLVSVGCDDLLGKRKSEVKSSLEDRGFVVKAETVETDEGEKDEVVDIAPCGKAPRGDSITIKVATGKAPGNASPKARASCLQQEIDPNFVCPSGKP